MAAECFLHQKGSAHMCPLHSSKFLYQRRWPFWTKCRSIFFLLLHGCCGWKCKWYWDGTLLAPFWTSTHHVHSDTRLLPLPSWSGQSTGESPTHSGGPIYSVSRGENSYFLFLSEVWKKEKPCYWLQLYQNKPRYAHMLPFTIKTVPLVKCMSYTDPDWHKYVASSSLETFLILKRHRESSFVAVNLDALICSRSVTFWNTVASIWGISPNFILTNCIPVSPGWNGHVKLTLSPCSTTVRGIFWGTSSLLARGNGNNRRNNAN